MKSKIDKFYELHASERICQGDLLTNMKLKIALKVENDKIQAQDLILPYAVIISQDCDLEQDKKSRDSSVHDKFIPTILLCPAYASEKVKEGSHMSRLGYTMVKYNRDEWKKVEQNKNERFHYLPADL